MQTFICDIVLNISASNLDVKRLGKQRIEAIQIAMCLLEKESKWKNHPAVKMWKGFEVFLVKEYLKSILDEWNKRGFKNEKCKEHYFRLLEKVKNKKIIKPYWINSEFIEAHRSNLIRKKPEFYKKLWSFTESNLEYIWPKGDIVYE